MVFIDTKDTHCPSIMEALNVLRLGNSCCDTCLVNGDHKIPAHKNVLIAGSDYFRSRFIGPFKDDDSDIDLSFVTLDTSSVGKVVTFLYTGQVDIGQENLESLLKVSSFLLISKLREHCIEFMRTTISQDTVIKYYFLSIDHTVVSLEKKLKETVKSRFHDWLIFDQSSLEISPEQLSFLIRNCEIFEFCSDDDILQYITEWVIAGGTASHESLACDILDYICKRKQLNDKTTESESLSLERLKTKLDGLLTHTDTLTKLQKAIKKYFRKTLSETKVYNFRSVESADGSPCHTDVLNGTVNALVAIVPNQRLKGYVEKTMSKASAEEIKDSESIFNIFIYIPQRKTWYHLSEGLYHGAFEDIIDEEYMFQFFGMKDKVCCVDPNYEVNSLDMVHLCDINSDEAFSLVEFSDVVAEFYTEEVYLQDTYCIISDDNTLYLILAVNLDSEQEYTLHFKCYRLNTDDRWQFMFSTPKIYLNVNVFGTICGCVSPVGNELILVYSRGHRAELLAYIAELREGQANANVIQLQADVPLSDEWHILKDNNRFYFVEVENLRWKVKRFACKYTYEFNSAVLSQHNDPGMEQDGSVVFDDGKDYEPLVNFQMRTSDEKSIWVFAGLEHFGSSLKEIFITKDGKINASNHVPPPFCFVTGIAVCKISPECLLKAKPVRRFDPLR